MIISKQGKLPEVPNLAVIEIQTVDELLELIRGRMMGLDDIYQGPFKKYLEMLAPGTLFRIGVEKHF